MFALKLIDNVEFHPIVKFFFEISQKTNVWKLNLNEFWLGEGDQANIRVCFFFFTSNYVAPQFYTKLLLMSD